MQARQTGMKFASSARRCYERLRLFTALRAACGGSDWAQENTHREKDTEPAQCLGVGLCERTRALRREGQRVPEGASGWLLSQNAPAGANVQHTQKEPHEWNSVQHAGYRFSLMYPWCQKRMLAKCIRTIDRNGMQSPPNKLDLVVYALKSFSCQMWFLSL